MHRGGARWGHGRCHLRTLLSEQTVWAARAVVQVGGYSRQDKGCRDAPAPPRPSTLTSGVLRCSPGPG
eukprot:2185168-Alexandrium_andersonii.AAC.1